MAPSGSGSFEERLLCKDEIQFFFIDKDMVTLLLLLDYIESVLARRKKEYCGGCCTTSTPYPLGFQLHAGYPHVPNVLIRNFLTKKRE